MKKQPALRWLRWIACLSMFPLSCCQNPEVDEPASDSLAGDASLNRQLIVSSYDFQADEGNLYSVNPATGQHTKLFSFEDVLVRNMVYHKDILYVGVGDNSVNALDLQKKELLWDLPLLEYYNSSLSKPRVAIHGNILCVNGYPDVLLAMDIETKKTLWSLHLNNDSYNNLGQATVTDDKVLIGTGNGSSNDNYLYCLDNKTGKLLWEKSMEAISGSIKVSGNIAVVPAKNMYAVEINTGNTIWEFPMNGVVDDGWASPVIASDKVLFQGTETTGKSRLHCLELATGKKLWEQEARVMEVENYTPTVVGNAVVAVLSGGSNDVRFTSGTAHVYAADLNSGKILWENKDISINQGHTTSPIVANGRVFVHGFNTVGEGDIKDRKGLFCLNATDGSVVWLNKDLQATPHVLLATNGVFYGD